MKKDKKSIILLIILLVSGCIGHGYEIAPLALFDMSHGEIFSPNDTSQTSYTYLYYQFYERGFNVGVNEEPISSYTLADVDVLILAGPMVEFDTKEIEAIKSFVKNGGNLLLLMHISNSVHDMLQEFGITCSGYIASDEENLVRSFHQNFYVLDLEEHPITKGVENIAVFGSWVLESGENASTIAWTTNSAWSDINRNREFDPGIEKRERLGIVSVTEYGRGKVVVIADDAVLIDMFIEKGDNRLFGTNIVEWFRG